MDVKGYGASIIATEDDFTVTANNSAGKGALGADSISLSYDEITGFFVKSAGMMTNGALTLGTDMGKITVHFLKKHTDGITQATDLLQQHGVAEDAAVTLLSTYSPKVEALKEKGAAAAAEKEAIETAKEAQKAAEKLAKNGEKICPDCAEVIKEAARKCRFCGYEYN
jgi:hypothetical protein